MRPTFHPRLVNGPGGDPALLVRLLGLGRNLLLDLGDLTRLPARPVLKADLAFVSHAHLDHFCGFDTVLRYSLGRARAFRVVGPPGIADRVEGKLRGYTWNLVGSYDAPFVVEALEWGDPGGRRWRFPCREGFPRLDGGPAELADAGPGLREVHRETAFRVVATALDHQVPSLAFRIEEPVHVNVARDALERLGVPPGPWVRRLKEAVQGGEDPATPIPLPGGGTATLGELLGGGAARASEGQRLAYVADCRWAEPGIPRAVALARGAHLLYCEAAFLDADRDRAHDRWHLTAAQAGELARRAGAAELRLFHVSPKYRGREAELVAEAAEAFGGPVGLGP
ncbi:MAG: MBL fold metallo-hydrolase [Deferrisomatales bacterium]